MYVGQKIQVQHKWVNNESKVELLIFHDQNGKVERKLNKQSFNACYKHEEVSNPCWDVLLKYDHKWT